MEEQILNEPKTPALQQGGVMRRFKELFNSRLKCERIGHDFETQKLTIRKRAGLEHYRAIVVDYEATQEVCKRCGERCELKEGKEKDWFTSCSMPSDMWDKMDEKGYLVL